MESNIETYLSELAAALQRRGADSQQTNAAVAEVERQHRETGKDPLESFGSPDEYAERLLLETERSKESEWDWRTFRATAFDEMDVLKDAGKQGWELVDVGLYALHCRRPRQVEQASQWEYIRRVSVNRQAVLETMTELGWEPCGTWLPFHYFKRRLEQPAEPRR